MITIEAMEAAIEGEYEVGEAINYYRYEYVFKMAHQNQVNHRTEYYHDAAGGYGGWFDSNMQSDPGSILLKDTEIKSIPYYLVVTDIESGELIEELGDKRILEDYFKEMESSERSEQQTATFEVQRFSEKSRMTIEEFEDMIKSMKGEHKRSYKGVKIKQLEDMIEQMKNNHKYHNMSNTIRIRKRNGTYKIGFELESYYQECVSNIYWF